MSDLVRRALLGAALACAALPSAASAGTAPQMSAEEQAFQQKMTTLAKSLHPQTGDIPIDAAKATLHLGQDYYFLNADESRKVIVEAWGNPPEQAEGVLGMVFPRGASFADADGWGAVVSYVNDGHVADDDAASADFDGILGQLREGEDERNKARKDAGYPESHLVGWAERPAYDRASHSVVWARDYAIGNQSDHSLNYDVRLLGRNGVLSLNMVSSMSQLSSVEAAARKFAATARFDRGFAYADYVEGVDKAAGYGIAGLIAAGVGVAAVKKLGLLALVLAFGKKFLVLLVAGGVAAWRAVKRFMGGKTEPQADAFVTPDPEPVPAMAVEESGDAAPGAPPAG